MEIEQKNLLTHERHRAYAALLRSHAAVMERIARRAKAGGVLSPEWYDVLLILEYAPEGRLRMGELHAGVTMSRSGLTRLVDRLEAAGYVSRRLNPDDRRSFEVSLTDSGRAERERSWPVYSRVIADEFGARYTEEQAAVLADLLNQQLEADATNGVQCCGENDE